MHDLATSINMGQAHCNLSIRTDAQLQVCMQLVLLLKTRIVSYIITSFIVVFVSQHFKKILYSTSVKSCIITMHVNSMKIRIHLCFRCSAINHELKGQSQRNITNYTDIHMILPVSVNTQSVNQKANWKKNEEKSGKPIKWMCMVCFHLHLIEFDAKKKRM